MKTFYLFSDFDHKIRPLSTLIIISKFSTQPTGATLGAFKDLTRPKSGYFWHTLLLDDLEWVIKYCYHNFIISFDLS